jgi:Putative lactococcus lactis phage r1t holin
MFGHYFWQATVERAVKSFAQSLLALLSAQQLGLLDVDWVTTLSTAGMATMLSVLTSIGSSQIGPMQDPSVVSSQSAPAPVKRPAAA